MVYVSVVDECVDDLYDCFPQNRSECIDQTDGFICQCLPGSEPGNGGWGGRNCVDIDECKRGKDDCHSDAKCINLDPGFDCECRKGFSGEGHGDDGCIGQFFRNNNYTVHRTVLVMVILSFVGHSDQCYWQCCLCFG